MTAPNPTLLRKAADVLRAGGWCQRHYVDGDAHCIVGSLYAAAETELRFDDMEYFYATVTGSVTVDQVLPAVTLLKELIGDDTLPDGDLNSIYAWNDMWGRSADDVIALLEQAAEKAEANS